MLELDLTPKGVGLNINPATDVRGYSHERQVPREGGWAKIKLYKTYVNIFHINNRPSSRVARQSHELMTTPATESNRTPSTESPVLPSLNLLLILSQVSSLCSVHLQQLQLDG